MRIWATFAITALVSLLLPAWALAEPLIAEVRLNGQGAGAIQFDRRGEDLVVQRASLSALRLQPPADPSEEVVLGALSGVRYTIDEARQVVDITADTAAISPSRLAMSRPMFQAPDTPAWGAALNYAAFAQAAGGGRADVSGVGELRVFGPRGVLTQSFSARGGQEKRGAGLRRLETSYVLEDYRRARRLIVGDFVSAGTAWAPPVRAGGVRLTSDLSLRPDIINQPLPQLRGAAATVSSVDLYVDGVRRLDADAPPGPFEIDAAPMIDGRGQVDMVVTDSLGRQSVQRLAFYAASELMAPGRTDYSLEAGMLREDFATEQDRYTDAFASLSVRRGMTPFMTLEAHAGTRSDRQLAGLEVTGKLLEEALFSIAYSQSRGSGPGGGQLFASARRETARYSVYATYQRRDENYRDLDERPGSMRVRQGLQLGAGWRDDRWGGFSFNYSRQERVDQKIGVASVSWSRGFGPVAFYANAFADDLGGGRRFSFGFSAPIGGRSASVSALSGPEGARLSASLSSPPPQPVGWGWRVLAEGGGGGASEGGRLEAEVRRVGGLGELGVAVSSFGGKGAGQAFASGSLLWMGGRPIAAARLGESFALVETGAPGIEVTVENRAAGRTGRDGRLLVPQLSSQTASHLALQAETVSLDHAIALHRAVVRPPRGAGVRIRMTVEPSRDAILQLIGADGLPLAPGLRVSLNGEPSGLTGYDGLAYVSGLSSQNLVEISGNAGSCRVEFQYDDSQRDGASVGPLLCRLREPDLFSAPGRVASNGDGPQLHR